MQQKTDSDEINVKISCLKWTIAVQIYLNFKPSQLEPIILKSTKLGRAGSSSLNDRLKHQN